jgi:hypothetical protein
MEAMSGSGAAADAEGRAAVPAAATTAVVANMRPAFRHVLVLAETPTTATLRSHVLTERSISATVRIAA